MIVYAKIVFEFESVWPTLCFGVFCGWPICFGLFVWANRKRRPDPERDDYTDQEPGRPKEGT